MTLHHALTESMQVHGNSFSDIYLGSYLAHTPNSAGRSCAVTSQHLPCAVAVFFVPLMTVLMVVSCYVFMYEWKCC